MINKETLMEFELFKGINSLEIDEILKISEEVTYKSKDFIIEDSCENNDLYVILEGRISVELSIRFYDYQGMEQLLILRPGHVFGEIAFLKDNRRSANVIAIDEVKAIKIDGKKLIDLLNHNNYLGYVMMRNIAKIVSDRLIDTNFKLRDSLQSLSK